MRIITDEKKIDHILTRGISQILPTKESFKKLLLSGKRIKIYEGFDPTAKDLHIGNAIGLKLLENFRKLGHQVIFLIGTGTGKIGDPTDKLATRKILTNEDITSNIKGWKKQASQILDFDNSNNPVTILRNGDWLDNMTLTDLLRIGNKITIQQLLERDMFQTRLAENKPISVSEFLYPIMQGYDSVHMEVDAEFGGNDQLFNMLVGRTLLKQLKSKEKWVITGKLIEDSNGTKMGKSLGNVVNLADSPENIYGKIMSFSDGMIVSAFEILTEISMPKIKDIAQDIKNGQNQMKYKKLLAFTVTKWIKGEEEAQLAQQYFENTVQGKQVPSKIKPTVALSRNQINTPLILSKVLSPNLSSGERKRIIKQGGFELDGKKITNPTQDISNDIKNESIYKLGKRSFQKIILKKG